MDILTHVCSGIASATVIASFPKKASMRIKILASGALGGAFPDVDAISMWSHFDSTFGRLFHLSHSGKVIYGAKFWYSHHAFFHSVAAALFFALIFGLLSYGIYKTVSRSGKETFSAYCKNHFLLAISFITGYLLHLFCDMPTPGSVWGGVDLFFPFAGYIGGSGKIWWWNNYDIFLLLVLCILINGALLFTLKQNIQQKAVIVVAVLTLALAEIQINTRQYNYAYSGQANRYSEMEQQSKREQERILGKRIYSSIEWLDRHLPVQF
ncbi:MAG: metal-dependent hydrolase [Paludibacter sp.]|nr:metal-dependent hydrolase [Paludibacter sp.]